MAWLHFQEFRRRALLPRCLIAAALAGGALAQQETYDTHAKEIRILPGMWRPHYPFEQIAWVSPSWPSQDYLWLDFPEAVFTSQGLLFLSHVNPPIPVVHPDLPPVSWRSTTGGIAFERELPGGVRFGGSVTRKQASVVELQLHLRNGSRQPLHRISLQTCVFLRAIREFGDYTAANKFVHTPRGWIPVSQALKADAVEGMPYRVGWRWHGKPLADLPVMVTVSSRGERLVAMTWHEHTLSLVSNPNHPCMHADPRFPDLPPGAEASITGHLIFFEGRLQDFDAAAQLEAARK
jgi:hypothetical protein